MIRRCDIEVSGKRCQMAAGHKSPCNPWLARNWCDTCRDYRPAQQHNRCGECGGAHAGDVRHQPPIHDRSAATRAGRAAARKRRIRERHLELKARGVL